MGDEGFWKDWQEQKTIFQLENPGHGIAEGLLPGVPAKAWSVGSSSPGPGFPSLQNGNAEVGECLVLTAHADPDSRLCAGSLLRRQTLCGQAGCCSFHASLTGPRLLLL